MFRRILPCIGLLALGGVLGACTNMGTPPAPTSATLDSGSHESGQSGSPQSGGAAAVGVPVRPSGSITTPTQ